jgi:predicted DNA-binding protein with PD1-like motif
MNGTPSIRVASAITLLALITTSTALGQAPAPPPLPDGYMRAPPVTAGLAPKMRVAETQGTAHVFDANFSAGDEIMSGLTDLVLEHNITSGYVTGLGGLAGALLAWGDPEVGAFKMIPVDEKCELISLLGHIAVRDGKPYVHLHAVVGFRDGSTKAGHVVEARVAPLAEISIVATSIGSAAH